MMEEHTAGSSGIDNDNEDNDDDDDNTDDDTDDGDNDDKRLCDAILSLHLCMRYGMLCFPAFGQLPRCTQAVCHLPQGSTKNKDFFFRSQTGGFA